ncbi:PTS sugar transporter subunit IIA [Enterococcus sp. AZ109]|uniref:PTS sugar transporter subunit IIA n=1 Tax=Enterococcus sp. AZ109 TaxID=2774634 RepID=UPI003F1F2637
MNFTEEHVLLNVDAQNQTELFVILADYAKELGIVEDTEKVRTAFTEREQQFSTGLQAGFAIPHAKSTYVLAPTVIYVRLKQPISWETFDDSLVVNVFALLVPMEDAGTLHLEMLSRLATALMEDSFIETIQQTDDKTLLAKQISKEMIGEKIV